MDKNMTALICLFVRAYHMKNSNIKIFNDKLSLKILSDEEYKNISFNMSNGIKFFNPNYNGDNALEWIVNNVLGPNVFARQALEEDAIKQELKLGLKQFVSLGSGYGTTQYRLDKRIKVFELDKEDVIKDKQERIKKCVKDLDNITYVPCDFNKDWINDLLNSGYEKDKKTFFSLLGISYYLDKEVFFNVIKSLSSVMPKGSVVLFDYPNNLMTTNKTKIEQLAHSSNEDMKSLYSFKEIEDTAYSCNMLIYRHLNNIYINNTYFYNYNTLNPNNKIVGDSHINYCLLVKQ